MKKPTWELKPPEFFEESTIRYSWTHWGLALFVDGKMVTRYALSTEHRPFVRKDSLERLGLTSQDVKDIKAQARDYWEKWLPIAHIVRGARP